MPLAQAPDSPDFDLARTVQQAIASSSQIAIQKKQVQIDAQRVDEAEAQDRPQISGNGRATHYDAPTVIDFSSGGSNSAAIPITVQKINEEALSLNLTERLDLLGDVNAARSQERLQQAADRAALASTTNGRSLQAKSIYFELLRSQHQVQVAESALRDAQTQETIARRLYENQVGQKIDLLRAQTNSAQAEQNLIAAQNGLDIARAAFNDVVGRPLGAPVAAHDVPGVNVGVDVQPASATADNSVQATSPDLTFFNLSVTEVDGIDIDRSIAAAQMRHPEVVENAALARASEIGVRIAREGMEPTFAIAAEGDYYPTTDFEFPRQKKAAFTISASIPFYDGGRTRDMVKEAHLRTDQALSVLDATKEDVALQARQAYLNLLTASRQISTANATLSEAIAARRLAQVRYEGQVGLFLEVTDAQAALVVAESAQVNAVYSYLTARAQFENALGVPALEQTNTLDPAGAPPAGAVTVGPVSAGAATASPETPAPATH
jgi:outer membrane protein TolC